MERMWAGILERFGQDVVLRGTETAACKAMVQPFPDRRAEQETARGIIAANALVLSNARLEPDSVYAGVPAKKVKEVTPEQRDEIIRRTAHDYMLYASWFKEE